MAHTALIRRLVRFPSILPTGGVIGCGLPGPGIVGGAQTDNATVFSSWINSAEQASSRLTIPRQKGRLPVAISIAPDSAIVSCNLSIGGDHGEATRHRLSPGNPMVLDCDDADFASVTLPNSIPVIGATSTTMAWDAQLVSTGAVEGLFLGWPLRLEFWYGELPITARVRERAPYQAHFLCRPTNVVEKDMFVCVDGRRRVEVFVYNDTGTLTLKCYAGTAIKAGSSAPTSDAVSWNQLPLNDAGDTSVAITGPGSNGIFSFFGNPMTLLKVNLSAADTSHDAQVIVKAWDN